MKVVRILNARFSHSSQILYYQAQYTDETSWNDSSCFLDPDGTMCKALELFEFGNSFYFSLE